MAWFICLLIGTSVNTLALTGQDRRGIGTKGEQWEKIGAAIYAIHKGWVGGHPPAVTPPPVDAAPYMRGRRPTVAACAL